MKDIPVLGIDDAGFDLFGIHVRTLPIFGVVMKGAATVEGVLQTTIEIDDANPSSKIIDMIRASDHLSHLKCILFEGMTIGGFGVIDPEQIISAINLPVIIVMKKIPDFDSIKKALQQHFEDWKDRWSLISQSGKPKHEKSIEIYFQNYGLSEHEATSILRTTIVNGKLPEAVRIAHLIGASYYQANKN